MINITPRQFNMPESVILPLHWYQGNPLLSSFFGGLSALLPDGEKFLIDTMREARAEISDPQLSKDISGFIGQEAHHSRAHRILNHALLQHQIDIPTMEKDFNIRILEPLRQGTLAERLAFGAAIEHFTAIFGEFVLSNPELLNNTPDIMQAFVLWHAIEELEHKSVVFDAFQYISGGDVRLRRRTFIKGFRLLTASVLRYQAQILKQSDYTPTWQSSRATFSYFFGWNGLFSANINRAMDYLKQDFHPYQHQQEHLIANWQSRYPLITRYLS